MRKIESHAELTQLIQLGDGFIFNNRNDRKMLHQVNCESLEVMSTRAYDKLFFEELITARNWLDKKYGKNGWEACGRCRAGHFPSATRSRARAGSNPFDFLERDL